MGNYVVTPPFNDWYLQPLKKLGVQVQDHMNSGTFFMILQGTLDGAEVIIKAYQYQESLADYPIVKHSQEYLQFLKQHDKETARIVKYSIATVQDNMAFLVRPKFDRTLVDVAMFQQPLPQLPEKRWIFFQLVMAMIRLHASGLAHGDIKPSNIFVKKDLSVLIGDPAPFKPAKISPTRPHLFYHFFTTDSTSGCYIAPERISGDEEGMVDLQVADWFSLGCVVYYLLSDGRHLFDLMKVKEYLAGNFELDKELMIIEDETLRGLVKGMLEIDLGKRRQISLQLLPYCPQFFDQLEELYRRFQVVIDDGVFEFQSTFIHLKGIVEGQDPDYRCIIFNYIENAITGITNLSDYKFAIEETTDFLEPCSDYFKLTRGIPFIMGFIGIKSSAILRDCLFAILGMIRTVKAIPEELDGFFEYYLKVELHQKCTAQPDVQEILAFAEVLPLLVKEMQRLEPKSMTSFAVAFSSIFTAQNITVFRVFAQSLKSVVSGGSKILNAFFYFILVALNYEDEFKEEVLDILKTFYLNTSDSDFMLYKSEIRKSVLPICNDLCTRNPTEHLQIVVFEFIETLMKRKLVDVEYAFEIIKTVNSCMFSECEELRYRVSKILEQFPPRARESNDWLFVFEHETQAPRKMSMTSLSRPKPAPEPRPSLADATLLNCTLLPQEEYSPRFLCSFHQSSCPVDFVVNTYVPDRILTIDRSKRMRWIKLPSGRTLLPLECQSHVLRECASAVCPMIHEKRFILGYPSGGMDSFDFLTAKKTRIFPNREDRGVTAIRQFNRDSILAGHADGSVAICDLRENHERLVGMRFGVGPIADICTWPYGNALAGIACRNGALGLVDTRMFLPILVVDTIPCKTVVPLATEGDKIAYLAMGDDRAEIAIEPRLSNNILYRERKPFRWATGYHGGAVIVDDKSASILTCAADTTSLRLYDGGSMKMSLEPFRDRMVLKSRDVSVANSIHKHVGTITCGTQCDDLFITGDNTGFIHVWRVRKTIRKMTT